MGTEQIPGWIGFLPDGLQQRFDVVSWDPRGIGASTAVQCFDSEADELAFLGEHSVFPVGKDQQQDYIERWQEFGQRCAGRNGELLEHVSTADTARDLDLLRQAVGDEKLTFIGLSYGTFLGATYANLFPDKVRAIVLDGNVAPDNWTNRGRPVASHNISRRIGSDTWASITLADLLTLCGATDRAHCAFSAGSPEATVDKFDQLLTRLEQGPIALTPSVTIGYAELLGEIAEGLDIVIPFDTPVDDQSSSGWAGIGAALQGIWDARNNPIPPAPVISPSPPETYAGPEQALSVVCGETPSPRPKRFFALAHAELAKNGPIGLASLWTDEPCSTWPARADNLYTGPWDRPTSAPILVVNTTTDPSTPLENAMLMVKQLANARLLTVDGYGHTVWLNPSDCASAAEVAYLVDGTLPPPGTVCPQNTAPFETPAGG
jgi:pimeloyl-ACP methyl ester carboxylesterase